MEIKTIKGIRLPPMKRSFKVKSLTMLLCVLEMDKCMDNVFIANTKLKSSNWRYHLRYSG